jgi:UV DNA damage repair endonuclease
MYLSTASDDQFLRWASRLLCLAALLDMMNLDSTHKIQIAAEDEVGISRPVAREADLARFDERQRRLPEAVQRRLVVESPHRHLALRDSLKLWNLTGIPIVYRTGFASVESLDAALSRCRGTWAEEDGMPVVDLHSPDVPSIDRLLAIAPEADYMLEADRLPDGLPTGRET